MMAMKKNNEHSPKFNKVQDYYDLWVVTDGKKGWSPKMVANAVVKGWITAEEYEEIIGEPYEENIKKDSIGAYVEVDQ